VADRLAAFLVFFFTVHSPNCFLLLRWRKSCSGLQFLAERASQELIYSAGRQPEVRDFTVGARVVVSGPRSFS
jgi:hypothetical protein